MNNNELLDQLIRDTRDVQQRARQLLSIDLKDLSAKPDADRWSVLQCVEHMNISDAHYLMELERVFNSPIERSSKSFRPGWLGNLFVKAIKPRANGHIPNKMKTFRKFQPEIDVHFDTLAKFIEDQDVLVDFINKCKQLDLNKNKVVSAIGRIVVFRLGDGLRFLTAHNQRHILQVENTLKEVQSTKEEMKAS